MRAFAAALATLAIGFALGLLLDGCAHGPYHEYEVKIDSSFTADEISGITAALDEWNEIGVGVSFEIELTNTVPDLPDNGVFIERASANGDCVEGRNVSARHVVGLEYKALGGYVECIDTQYSPIRLVALHETGHVLGLQHSNPPSVMTPSLDEAAQHITPQDVTQFCNEAGWC